MTGPSLPPDAPGDAAQAPPREGVDVAAHPTAGATVVPPPTTPPGAGQASPRGLLVLATVFVLALALGAWGLWSLLAAPSGDPAAAPQQVAQLEQQVATLARSDQISREANRDLQGTLAERDEEIAGLRADVAFYERFVGATGQRRGLAVHELRFQHQAGDAWHFTATLTQNLNRGTVSRGRLTLEVEGSQDGQLRRLAWADLRQQPNAGGSEYSFKYFQQLDGDLLIPAGFQPLRVHARLQPAGGAVVERSFAWNEVVAAAGA